MSDLIVLYDACVLYPAPLRDLLMQLALSGIYQAKWSEQIHEEWIRNVLKNRPDLTRQQLDDVKDLMNQYALDALVVNYESLIDFLVLPDKNDRHVLAAAICASASVILTFNLKDFPVDYLNRYGIEARHPDDFINRLIDIDPDSVCHAIKTCRQRLKSPSFDIDRYLCNLERQSIPATILKLQEFKDFL